MKLPFEVWDDIFKYLDDGYDIHSLARVCRGLRDVSKEAKGDHAILARRYRTVKPMSLKPILDFLDINEPSRSSAPTSGDITVRPEERAQLLEVLSTYKAVQRAGTLLTLTFVTVNDYLWLLRAVSQEMGVLGRNCLYYLAAAVSDFFLPRQKMVRLAMPAHFLRLRRRHTLSALMPTRSC